ncbi:MAG: DsrE/DsrF/DrsH-like family protein [Gemmatimonadetes bacterium]|nr:DsrE/DsrF/DrsH-like family protein [Gemmatimonadota bacterium]
MSAHAPPNSGHGNGRDRRRRRLAMVASKGTLDGAYPPLILATTAASLGWEVGIFFTFYGLDIIHRKKHTRLKVPSLANPAMPVPVPNLVGALPGMTAVATAMMRNWMKHSRLPDVPTFLNMARESGVKLFACSTTMGVMGVEEKDLVPGTDIAGATAFLDFVADADVSLFI